MLPRSMVRALTCGASVVAVCAAFATEAFAQQAIDKPPARANRLAKESSPYLLQHAHNPVDWFPWGPEAFERAKAEKKPIFLSIGYSTCYWCHVMERESFENEKIAAYLNEHFICIKVDREERPDVDQIYMAAVQAFQGRGGWPMSVFCFPDGRPFFAGTYYPAEPREGMETFPRLAERVVEAWRDHRDELDSDADKVKDLIQRLTKSGVGSPDASLSPRIFGAAAASLAEQFDPEYGGFGFDPDNPMRPKFPEPTNLLFLLEEQTAGGRLPSLIGAAAPGADRAPLSMVETTLDHISRGGIRDHLGGGYHRYSTDRAWAVPHFEKMLYDNALLAIVYSRAFELTDDTRWKGEVQGIFECVARDFTSPEGAFYSALDAEVDGEEGASYVWTKAEIQSILGDGDPLSAFSRAYGLDRSPNFEGDRYVLLQPNIEPVTDNSIAQSRDKLLAARAKRKQPRRDDKILTAWNALMIVAYSEAARVFEDESYELSATRAADFVWDKLRDSDGRVLRSYRNGEARVPGYLEDYAYATWAMLTLHGVTGEPRFRERAVQLANRIVEDFSDEEQGGFYVTANGHDALIARPKDFADGALPSANAVAVKVLLELANVTNDDRYSKAAERAVGAFSGAMLRAPSASPTMLSALRLYFARPGAARATNDPLGIGNGTEVVEASLEGIPTDAIAPGETAEVRVRLKIAKGWHIYANPVGAANLLPTTVTLGSNESTTLNEMRYPEGARKTLAGSPGPVNIYESELEIPVSVAVNGDAPAGPLDLVVRVRYQACDERACLAPVRVDLPLTIQIKAR